MKSTTVRARIDENLKFDVEQILGSLNLSLSEAIGLYMAQIKLKRGIPFDIRVPNDVTLQTFHDTDNDKNLVRCRDAKDMFDKLEI